MSTDDPASANGPEPDASGDTSSPFERFEQVLKKVLTVPKSDIDEKRRSRRRGKA